MYTFDNRSRNKSDEELMRDKLNIMQAFKDLFGVQDFSYWDKGSRVKTNQNKTVVIGQVWLLEEKGIGGRLKTSFVDMSLLKNNHFIFKPKPLGQFQAMGYGEVVYIAHTLSSQLTRVYVHLKGKTLLTVDYKDIDLWEFSLYYQQALKENEEHEFMQQLKKDKFFFRK